MAAIERHAVVAKGLLLQRDFVEVSGAIDEARLVVSGALVGLAEAHDALVRSLQLTQEQLQSVSNEQEQARGRLHVLEDGSAEQNRIVLQILERLELQDRKLQSAISPYDLLRKDVNQLVDENAGMKAVVDYWKQGHQALGQRLNAAERSLEALADDSRSSEEWKTLVPVHDALLKELRANLAARSESETAAPFEERLRTIEGNASEQLHRIGKLELDLQEQRSNAVAGLAVIEDRFIALRLDIRGDIEKLSSQAAHVEKQLSTSNGFAEQLAASLRDARTAMDEAVGGAREAAAAAISEGAKLGSLEARMAEAEQARLEFEELVRKETQAARGDVAALRDWATKRIESVAQLSRSCAADQRANEGQVKAFAERITQFAARQDRCHEEIDLLKESFREWTRLESKRLERLEAFAHRQDADVKQLREVSPVVESSTLRAQEHRHASDGAAATTSSCARCSRGRSPTSAASTCLSCGRLRSPSPGSSWTSRNNAVRGSLVPGSFGAELLQSSNIGSPKEGTADRSARPAFFSSVGDGSPVRRSQFLAEQRAAKERLPVRPASAGSIVKPANAPPWLSEVVGSALVVGAAHAACRTIVTPRKRPSRATQRPSSASSAPSSNR